jgi:hypothetical protein
VRSSCAANHLGPEIAEQIVDLVLTVYGNPEPRRRRQPSS